MRRLFKLNTGGFTLIEAVISLALLSIAIVGFIMMQSKFAMQTADRTLLNALGDAASSALTQCQTISSTPGVLNYAFNKNLAVTVALSGSCAASAGNCNVVTATASAGGKSTKLTTQVCNFQ